jgi:hypothetical protein
MLIVLHVPAFFSCFPAEDLEGEIEDIELSEGAAAALAASRCAQL